MRLNEQCRFKDFQSDERPNKASGTGCDDREPAKPEGTPLTRLVAARNLVQKAICIHNVDKDFVWDTVRAVCCHPSGGQDINGG
jgi:hypothetical protein